MLDRIFNALMGEDEKANCGRCGKPFHRWKYGSSNLCSSCRAQFQRELRRLVAAMPRTMPCGYCNGVGRIKGYNCAKCGGRCSVKMTPECRNSQILELIRVLCQKPEWNAVTVYDDPPDLNITRI